MNTKTESIYIDSDSEIDDKIVANFIKCCQNYFLKKNLANNSTTSNKKSFFPKNKTQAFKVEIKGDKRNPNEKPNGVHCYECSVYDHYAHVCQPEKDEG